MNRHACWNTSLCGGSSSQSRSDLTFVSCPSSQVSNMLTPTVRTKRKPAKGQHPIAEQHQPRFSSKKKIGLIRGEPYTTEPSIELASANNLPSSPRFPAVESHLFLMKRHRDTDCSNMKLITVPHVHPVGYKPGNAD